MNGKRGFGSGGGRGRKTGPGAAGAQGKDGQRRPMFRRRKVCKFCSDKIDDINYKDTRLLLPFVPERAKILPRRISGTCGGLGKKKSRNRGSGSLQGAEPVSSSLQCFECRFPGAA